MMWGTILWWRECRSELPLVALIRVNLLSWVLMLLVTVRRTLLCCLGLRVV